MTEDTDSIDEIRGERRWPAALAVLACIWFTLTLPERFTSVHWVFPVVEILLLIVIIVRDPGRIDDESGALRKAAISLVALLVLVALSSTVILINDLVVGSEETSKASTLLITGGVVWASNIIAFSLLYWELDCGGPAARLHNMPPSPGFAFPQQMDPEVAPPNWRPQYVDYFYVALTASTAFSPTDAMPLLAWAKLAMALESLISLILFGLVLARAVNVMT